MSFKQYVDPASVPGGVGSAEYAAALDAARECAKSQFACSRAAAGCARSYI